MESRKRKVLTLDEKLECIKLNEKGESFGIISKKFDVGKTQIYNIIQNKNEIIRQFESGKNLKTKLLKERKSPYSKVNDKLFEWYLDFKSKNMHVSGKLLQEKGKELAHNLNLNTFSASNGWLSRFLIRHNIKITPMNDESARISSEVIENWESRLPYFCLGYNPNDIFNCDETGLFFKVPPSKIMGIKDEAFCGLKKAKDRITVLLATSMKGEKLMPLVIGKSKNPKCFQSINIFNLKVYYEANSKALMTSLIFQNWITKLNQKMKSENRKIIMFMDNCSSHPHLEYSNIKLAFFPPNMTSMLQPMNSGIVQTVKLRYKNKLLRHMLLMLDNTETIDELIGKLTLLDAIIWLTSAWESVSSELINKCFKNCGFKFLNVKEEEINYVQEVDIDDNINKILNVKENIINDVQEEESDEEIVKLGPSDISLEEYASYDDCIHMEDNDLVDAELSIKQEFKEENFDDDNNVDEIITSKQAWDMMHKLLKFSLIQNNPELAECFSKAQELFRK